MSNLMANIAHFGKYYFPDTGGIESVTISVARGAASAGHSVSVVCFDKTPVESEVVLDGVNVIRAPIARLIASQPLGFKYFSRCLEAAKGADVVHLHAPNMLAALCALLISRKTRLLVHWHSDVIDKGLLGKILRPLEFALLKRADCIVVTSQVYADASETLAPYRNKITIVPIGVPAPQHTDEISTLPRQIEERIAGKKIVLTVGRLVRYKSFDVLIEAATHLSPGSIVVIVGEGALWQDLQKTIHSAGVGDRVIMAGSLSDAALRALYERAALYCLPSTHRAEAFGVGMVEAMAYGLPIVASDIPGSGVPWVNQHGTSGFNVPVGDPKAMAGACNQILGSAELRRNLASGAHQRFLSEFTEDVSVRRMMDAYDRLLSSEV